MGDELEFAMDSRVTSIAPDGFRQMQLNYGFNEIDGWPAFALGEDREKIYRRLRLMGTKVVRVFVFDKPVPDPFKEWNYFAAVVDGVLASGAKPMVTFAKFLPRYDDPKKVARFVARCSEMVWSCLEHWGADEVRDWFWCVWNEPNNPDVGGNLRYKDYLNIYREVAEPVLELLEPHMVHGSVKLGGPSIDGTQRAYWLDWIAQLLDDLDDRVLGFVNWHMYADWRPAVPHDKVIVKLVDEPDAPNGAVYEALAMARTPQYEARARSVASLLKGRNVLNFCGELNTIAHHDDAFTSGLNQNLFGGAYYISALINLIRGGAQLEMRWTATAKRWNGVDDAYGLIFADGTLTPAGLAKQLFCQHIKFGDWVRFPIATYDNFGIDAIVAQNEAGRRSAVFVNTSSTVQRFEISRWDRSLKGCADVLRIDSSTNGKVVKEGVKEPLTIEGYGLLVVTDASEGTVLD